MMLKLTDWNKIFPHSPVWPSVGSLKHFDTRSIEACINFTIEESDNDFFSKLHFILAWEWSFINI